MGAGGGLVLVAKHHASWLVGRMAQSRTLRTTTYQHRFFTTKCMLRLVVSEISLSLESLRGAAHWESCVHQSYLDFGVFLLGEGEPCRLLQAVVDGAQAVDDEVGSSLQTEGLSQRLCAAPPSCCHTSKTSLIRSYRLVHEGACFYHLGINKVLCCHYGHGDITLSLDFGGGRASGSGHRGGGARGLPDGLRT